MPDQMREMQKVNEQAGVLRRRSAKLVLQGLALKRALERKQKREGRLAFVKKLPRKRK